MKSINFVVYHSSEIEMRKTLLTGLFYLWQSYVENIIIRLFLIALWKLIYDVYWFCCLLSCRDGNKENFAHQSFHQSFVTRLRRKHSFMCSELHLRSGSFGDVLSPRSLLFLHVKLTWNWKNWKSFFWRGIRTIISQEIWIIDEIVNQVILQCLSIIASEEILMLKKRDAWKYNYYKWKLRNNVSNLVDETLL